MARKDNGERTGAQRGKARAPRELKHGAEREVTLGRRDFIARHGLWTPDQADAAERARRMVIDEDLRLVRVGFTDTHGIVRGKTLVADEFLAVLKNGMSITSALLAMDTGNIICLPVFQEDGGFGVKEMGGAGDLILVPDPATFRVLPWANKTGWVLGDLYLSTGAPVPFDTRRLMKNMLVNLDRAGFEYVAGIEIEFHIFKLMDETYDLARATHPPEAPRVQSLANGYQYQAEFRMDEMARIWDELHDHLVAVGVPLRTMEDEWGPGQSEFTLDIRTGIVPADMVVLLRSAVKQICRRRGLLATFMCKPSLPNVYSSGWHLHQSLRSKKSGENVFPDPTGKHLLSETGRHFTGGLLEHARACCAFAIPTINGYKRINANPLAPTRALWARDNKGAFIRVVGGGAESITHLENRSGEPAANPYLFMASQIVAGLDGIGRRTDPGEPRSDPYAQVDMPALPTSLMEAVDALDRSALFRKTFGGFVDYYLALKRSEIHRFLSHVTDWEQREYFEAF